MRATSLLWCGLVACAGGVEPARSASDALVTPKAVAVPPVTAAPPVFVEGAWLTLEPGLQMRRFVSEVPHLVGDGGIHVLRIDPHYYDIVAHMASRDETGWHGVEMWAQTHDMIAVTNSSMFHASGRSVFQLVDGAHSNSEAWQRNANNVLVSDSTNGALPRAQIVDTTCQSQSTVSTYSLKVQSWRLLDCAGKPTWKVNRKVWSHALIGQDAEGHILFIHARTPYNTRVFTDILLSLPLKLTRLQYAEGGPEAGLYVSAGGTRFLEVGSYETDFTEHDNNRLQWNLPNVVGVRRRSAPTSEASAK